MEKGVILALLAVCACICLVSSSFGAAMFMKGGSNPLSGLVGGGSGTQPGGGEPGGGEPSGGEPGVSTGGGNGGLGPLTKEDGKCGSGQVKNDAGKCVPLTVLSGLYGTDTRGGLNVGECPDGSFITGINVGYDHKVKELKYLAAGCNDGRREWSHGRSGPSNLGKSIASALSMGIATPFLKPDSGYENRTWINPASPGWDQIAWVLDFEGKHGNLPRAFGPTPTLNKAQETGMFGILDHRSGYYGVHGSGADQLQDPKVREAIKTWRCDEGGAPPSGKRYAIVGFNTYADKHAVTRFQAKCRMFDKT